MKQNTNHHLQSLFNLSFKPQNSHNSQSMNQKPFTIFLHSQTHQKAFTSKSKASIWTNQQKQRYSIFICYFRQILSQSPSNFNEWNMFKAMSKYIGSRNPQQCRSYHVRLLRQFHTIGRFIEIVAKRLPSLRQKIIRAEDELNRLQLQFNLFIEQQVLQQQKHLNPIIYNVDDKSVCKPLPKTSDTYMQEPNPVGQQYHNFGINSFQTYNNKSSFDSNFKSYAFKPTAKGSIPSFAQNKNSLPSFAEQQESQKQEKFIKLQSKYNKNQFTNFQWKNSNQNWPHQQLLKLKQDNNLFLKQKNVIEDNVQIKDTFEYKKEALPFPPSDQSSKGLQKMKEILECHYLFQLWTSKLQKIMRQ